MAALIDFKVGTEFRSYKEFSERFKQYQEQVFCNYAVASSNPLKTSETITQGFVDAYYYRYAKFVCKFGGEARQTVGPQNRLRQTSTYRQNCESFFTTSLCQKENGHVLVIKKMNENHSHVCSQNLFKSLPNQRRDLIRSCESYLNKVIDVRPNIQMIQAQISSENSVVKRKDLYNHRAKQNNQNVDPIESNDLEQMIREMCSVQGASVKVYHNDQNELEAIYFQDERMKTYFDRFPEMLSFDGTYCLIDRRMPLVILLVVDGNGESQIVGFFIVKSENANTLNFLFESFKDENPKHDQIGVVLTDKNFAARNVIEAQFPQAAHHLCVFHVAQIFIREITTVKRGINTIQKDQCLKILNKMIYAESQNEFDSLYDELQRTDCAGKCFELYER